MTSGFSTSAEQIRAHASNVDSVRARFAAVKAASAHISQNDEAYGLLCRWMPAILEGRHAKQDELLAYVEENLAMAVDGLKSTASGYDQSEADATDAMKAIGQNLSD